MYKLSEEKYQNAILYLAKNVGKGSIWGKKKLYKLLYFLDFDFFEQFERPITGDTYHKLQMGPAPQYLAAITEEMIKDNQLEVSNRPTGPGYNDTIVYKALKEPNLKVFDKNEIKALKRIIAIYGDKTGSELEKLSHKEAPYLAVEEGEEIPLELAHYRGTNFNK